MKHPWFKFFGADWFQSDARTLGTPEERAVYIDLLAMAWGSPVPGYLAGGSVEAPRYYSRDQIVGKLTTQHLGFEAVRSTLEGLEAGGYLAEDGDGLLFQPQSLERATLEGELSDKRRKAAFERWKRERERSSEGGRKKKASKASALHDASDLQCKSDATSKAIAIPQNQIQNQIQNPISIPQVSDAGEGEVEVDFSGILETWNTYTRRSGKSIGSMTDKRKSMLLERVVEYPEAGSPRWWIDHLSRANLSMILFARWFSFDWLIGSPEPFDRFAQGGYALRMYEDEETQGVNVSQWPWISQYRKVFGVDPGDLSSLDHSSLCSRVWKASREDPTDQDVWTSIFERVSEARGVVEFGEIAANIEQWVGAQPGGADHDHH